MIAQVIVKSPGGAFWQCQMIAHRDGPAWACGPCQYVLGSDGFLAIGMICPGCGSVIVAMRAAVSVEPSVVFISGDGSIHTISSTSAPSDIGIDGALPLPPDEWHPAFTEEGWAEQNRKINDLLMGRAG